MKEKQDDFASSTHQTLPGFGANPFEKPTTPTSLRDTVDRDELENPLEQNPEDKLGDSLVDNLVDNYEEPDRDTDFSIGFREEAVAEIDEEEAFETLLPDDLEEDDSELFAEQEAFLHTEAIDLAAADADLAEEDEVWDSEPVPELAEDWESDSESPAWEESPWQEPEWNSATAEARTNTEEPAPVSWTEEEEYLETEQQERFPMSLLVVGAIALLLVIAGVYGVVQQRSATQEEIRQLQASLATAANPEEVEASRLAVQQANERGDQLTATIDSLRAENQRLVDTIAGLEAQLESQQAAPAKAAPAPVKPAAKPVAPAKAAAPAPKPAAAPAAAIDGDWFVNFGSYGQRAVAQDWADRLRPTAGEVVVAPSVKDGRTFYRVRVINLPDKAAAQRVAQNLQSSYGLPSLWVGQQ